MSQHEITLADALPIIKAIIRDRIENGRNKDQLTPILVGDPGLGKTTVYRQAAAEVAEETGYEVEEKTLIVAQYDPGEFGGIVYPEDRKTVKLRPEWMPDKDASPRGLLILDELGQAITMQMNLSAQLIEEGRIGKHALPQHWAIGATTNKLSNRAAVNPLPSHLRDRLLFLPVRSDVESWLDWGAKSGIDPAILAFIKFRGGDWLHKFDPAADVSASPRSWAKLSHQRKLPGLSDAERRIMAKGTVGEGAALEFDSFLKTVNRLPSLEAIWANPKTHEIPSETDPGLCYALISSLFARCTARTMQATMEYVSRWPQMEMVMFGLRALKQRDAALSAHPAVRDWALRKGTKLYAV